MTRPTPQQVRSMTTNPEHIAFLRAKWARYKLRSEFRAKMAAGVTTYIKWFKECPHGVTIWDATVEPIETHPKWIEAFSDETECERRQHHRASA